MYNSSILCVLKFLPIAVECFFRTQAPLLSKTKKFCHHHSLRRVYTRVGDLSINTGRKYSVHIVPYTLFSFLNNKWTS